MFVRQQQLDEEEIAKQLEKLTPEERVELEKVKNQWEAIQREKNKSIQEHLRDYKWSDEEKEALRYCAVRVGAASGVGGVAFAVVGDLWLRKVRGVTRPLPRALFFVPTTVAGLLTGFGFTSGLCINRLSELNSPLGASMRDMLRARTLATHGASPDVAPNLENLNKPPGAERFGRPGGPAAAAPEARPAWQDAILAEKKEGDLPAQKS